MQMLTWIEQRGDCADLITQRRALMKCFCHQPEGATVIINFRKEETTLIKAQVSRLPTFWVLFLHEMYPLINDKYYVKQKNATIS